MRCLQILKMHFCGGRLFVANQYYFISHGRTVCNCAAEVLCFALSIQNQNEKRAFETKRKRAKRGNQVCQMLSPHFHKFLDFHFYPYQTKQYF